MARSIHCGDYGEPLPLQNLGSLAQAYNRGNTRVPCLLPYGRSPRGHDDVVAESATLKQSQRNLLPAHRWQFWQTPLIGEVEAYLRIPGFAQNSHQVFAK
jgi:hypothetical protein